MCMIETSFILLVVVTWFHNHKYESCSSPFFSVLSKEGRGCRTHRANNAECNTLVTVSDDQSLTRQTVSSPNQSTGAVPVNVRENSSAQESITPPASKENENNQEIHEKARIRTNG